jgi:hypothetical protein
MRSPHTFQVHVIIRIPAKITINAKRAWRQRLLDPVRFVSVNSIDLQFNIGKGERCLQDWQLGTGCIHLFGREQSVNQNFLLARS